MYSQATDDQCFRDPVALHDWADRYLAHTIHFLLYYYDDETGMIIVISLLFSS